MIMIAFIAVFALDQGAAQAFCDKQNLEGIFKNGGGDRFKIEQANCNELVFTDLQTEEEFVGSFSNPTNAITGVIPVISEGFLPKIPLTAITFSLDKSEWKEGFTSIHFQTRLKLKQKAIQEGLTSPPIKFTLLIKRSNEQYPSVAPEKINLWSFSFEGVAVDSNASHLDKAFASGFNLGLTYFFSLFNKSLDFLNVRDELTRVH